MARLTRRGTPRSAGGVVLATLAGCRSEAPAAVTPLLALSDQFMSLQAVVDAANTGSGDVTDKQLAAAVEQQARLLDQMGDLTATTLAEHRARALALDRYYTRDSDGDLESEVSWHRIGPLFRDLLREAV